MRLDRSPPHASFAGVFMMAGAGEQQQRDAYSEGFP
jgi:hypothetical protein